MKKAIWITLIIIAILGVGLGAWLWFGVSTQKSGNSKLDESNTEERIDFTNREAVSLKIRDLSYSPPNIRITKGTKVTWTNEDTMGHNVVADDPTATGGLPTDYPVFGRGESYSVIFNDVGIYRYHCTPHSFMHGSVEVVE